MNKVLIKKKYVVLKFKFLNYDSFKYMFYILKKKKKKKKKKVVMMKIKIKIKICIIFNNFSPC